MAAHKPLPSLPNPEGAFRLTTLSAPAKSHRGQLLRHFLQHDIDQPEPALTPRQQEAWVGVIERSLDDIGDLFAQQDWLAAVRKGGVVKKRSSKTVATGSAPAASTPDKPLPELDPLRIVRTLATRPKPATKKPRPGHLVLCIAPHRGADLPTEDSGFDIVPANLVCTFKPGRYYVEESTILYGLQGISNETLETPISLVGGSFVLKGVTTHRQYQRLRNLLHIAVYIHFSLILEQHLFVNSHVAIQYRVPPSDVPPSSDAPIDVNPTNDDPQPTNSKEDYTLFAWSSNLRKRATMIPSSFNFGNFNFFSRRNSMSNPGPSQPRNGGSLDLPSYNWSGNKDSAARKSIEAPRTTPPKPPSAAADPASTNDPPLTPPSTSTPASTSASTSQPAQTEPQSQPPPPQPQPEVQTPPAETQVQPPSLPSEAEPPLANHDGTPHPHRFHRLSFRAVGGLNGERRPSLAAALRRRPTVAGTKPDSSHTRPLSVWSFLPGSSSSPSSASPSAQPNTNPNVTANGHPGPSSSGNIAPNDHDNVASSGALYDASTGPPPALPFSTALARLEESKAFLSTSPNLLIPPPKLLVDLAERERSYHQYEHDSRQNAANLTRRRQEQRNHQVALGAGVGRVAARGAGQSGQWPWWMKGDEKVALSTLMMCSYGEDDWNLASTQGQGQGGPSRQGTNLRALLGLEPESAVSNAGGSGSKRKSPLRNFAVHQSISVLWSVHVPCSPGSGSGIKMGSTKEKGKEKEKEVEKEKEAGQVDDSNLTSSRLTASSTTTVSTSATTTTANTSKITTTSSMRDPDTVPSSSSSLQTQTIACGKPYRQTYQFYTTPTSPLHPDTADASLGSVIYGWINDRHLACEVRPSLCPFERGNHERRLIHGGVMVSITVEDGEEEELEKAEELTKVVIVPNEGGSPDPVTEEVDDKGDVKVEDAALKKDDDKKDGDESPGDPEKTDDPPPDKTPLEDSDLQDIEVVHMQMYLSCSVCGTRSKRLNMDDGTALLSFGKFIELVIYSSSLYTLAPPLCDHTTPRTSNPTHDEHFSHISPNLLRHFYLPPNPTKPLEPTGQVTLSARPIEDSVFEICLPRMQILSGLGVDGSGKFVNFAPGFNASGAFRNALALGAGITKKARSFSARRLRRSEAGDDTGGATQNWRAEERERKRDQAAFPNEGEQKRVLRMEIKRWWEGVAVHVDQIEKALDEQEKAQDALLSRNPSQARRLQKALPRLPSAHDAYDVFEVLAEGKTADPSTPRSTSVSTAASTSKFTTNSRTDSDAMSTLKESDAEDEGGKTPTPLPPVNLPPQDEDEPGDTESGSRTPKAERPASEDDKPTDDAPPSDVAQPPLPTESTVSLAPTLPPKDDIHVKRTTSASSQAPPPPPATSAPPDATAPKPEDVQLPPEQPSVLLASLRHNFHQLEHGLYTQLAKTPEARLNDVRRSFLSVAKGTEKRLRAWENKHLKNKTGKKSESGSGIVKREGLSRRNTNESVKLATPEPEWWGKGCHVLPGGDVIVREGDWGSIIAHTLSSPEYLVELGNMISGRVISISSTASTGTATGAPSFPSSAPTTPRDDRGTSSSYPSSFFSLPGRYKLFSSPVALPDPDDDGTDWHEQESYFAVVSRKQHHREATPTPIPNHSAGSTLASNSSMRDAVIARVPKKETADAQEGIITTATRVAISAVAAPAAILTSKPAAPAAPSPQPVVKARADVRVSMEAAKGEINSSGDVEKFVLKDVGGTAPVESPLPDIPAARASLEQVDTQLKRTNAHNISKASEKVALEAEARQGDIHKDKVERKGKERMSTDDSASITTLPPLPPPKDTREPQAAPVPPPKPLFKPTDPPPAAAADDAPHPPPTSSGFATALANGLQSVAMRFMMHSEPVTRNVTPSQPTVKHHELLGSQPLPISQPSLFAIDDRPHIKYEWTIGKRLKFSCTTYYAKQFDLLRKRCGIDDIYVKSLSRSVNWAAEGGKSKSNFWKTSDDRFIIKTLVNAWNVADLQVLIELAPSYFRYMESTANKATVLAKLAGFYTIEIRNLETGAIQAKADLLVMENLFYDRHVNKTFDLKGIQGRKVKAKSPTSKTLFDGEWIEGQQRSITLVHPYSKVTMKEAIQTDAEFLAKSNIMDYSLLMGFDQEKRQIACGLVDTIGSFTFAKTLEYKAKHNLQPGTKEVTVMPPTEYQERFVKSLDDYIVACPDKWSKPLDNRRLNHDPTRLPCVL